MLGKEVVFKTIDDECWGKKYGFKKAIVVEEGEDESCKWLKIKFEDGKVLEVADYEVMMIVGFED